MPRRLHLAQRTVLESSGRFYGVLLGWWPAGTPFEQPLSLDIADKALWRMPWLLKGIVSPNSAVAATGSTEGFSDYTIQHPNPFGLRPDQTRVGTSRAKRHTTIKADLKETLYFSQTPMAGLARHAFLMGWVTAKPTAQALVDADAAGSLHFSRNALRPPD